MLRTARSGRTTKNEVTRAAAAVVKTANTTRPATRAGRTVPERTRAITAPGRAATAVIAQTSVARPRTGRTAAGYGARPPRQWDFRRTPTLYSGHHAREHAQATALPGAAGLRRHVHVSLAAGRGDARLSGIRLDPA